MLKLDLQYFAKDGPGGERTEPATQKKLEDVRKDGKVVKSKEISNCLILLALFLLLKLTLGFMGTRFTGIFQSVYAKIPEFSTLYGGYIDQNLYISMLMDMSLQSGLLVLPFLGAAFVLSFVIDLVQVKWKPTTKPLRPKFSNMNPINGFKKLFSAQSLVELLKAILKIALVIWVAYSTLRNQWPKLYLLYDVSLGQGLAVLGDTVINLGLKISAIYVVIAAADYAYQKYRFKEDTKMTKQEVKEEFKNQEGDPQVKSKQKQVMMKASMRRMMQDIPKADVVITNPTHFAVALMYDDSKYSAPVVVAKGADYLAQRIKDVARENNVEIVENVPLARNLYKNVEIGQMIPPELFPAVAEILAAVYRAQGKV